MTSKVYLVKILTSRNVDSTDKTASANKKTQAKVSHYFIILPDNSTSQEQSVSWLRPGFGQGYLYKPLRQVDGSVLQTYRASRTLERGFWPMFEALRAMAPKHIKIVPEDVFRTYTKIEEFAQLRTFPADLNNWEYRAYETHRFYNGSRYIPLVINTVDNRCYNISELFPRLIPEDEIGVLVSKEEAVTRTLSLPGLPTPTIFTFLSNIRMCPTCFHVHDLTKPPKRPWLSTRWQELRAKYRS